MRPWTGGAIVAVAALFAAPSAGAPITDYTSLHVFGDSLSDRGNVYRATFGREPESPPYWRGRFSNGPVWADRVEARFRALDLPTGNHAWGGAEADASDLNFDLGLQASRYRLIDDDRRGDRPLATIWAGANDFKDVVGDPNPDVLAEARDAASAVGDAAASLSRAGVHDFLIFNMPDLGKVPKYRSRDDPADALSATVYTRAYNRQLGAEIAGLRDDGVSVTAVNSYGLFNAMIADPARFGLRNMTVPCLIGDTVCSGPAARRRAFFDEIHPNFVVHQRIAEAALAAIATAPAGGVAALAAPAPVPLPAPAGLLAAGLLSLGLLVHRRNSRPNRR
jgi:outer membrane lipase/esterase